LGTCRDRLQPHRGRQPGRDHQRARDRRQGLGTSLLSRFRRGIERRRGLEQQQRRALYVSAYRHIHDRFVALGATNVVWAWCPNVTDTDGSNKQTMDYYPGDDYVDWTGVDGYNWGGRDWESFAQVFARIYPLLAAKRKPILIGEMSSSANGGDKAAWIDAIVPTLKSSYPLIKGLVWFDINKEEDWRIDSSTQTMAAFKRMAADPYLNP
jgi:beta-mannanase